MSTFSAHADSTKAFCDTKVNRYLSQPREREREKSGRDWDEGKAETKNKWHLLDILWIDQEKSSKRWGKQRCKIAQKNQQPA